MPTYEYLCTCCGNQFEVFQKMKDEPISVCPKCGKSVKRIISGGLGINFIGSGFYANDHAVKQEKKTSSGCSSCASSCCSGCKK